MQSRADFMSFHFMVCVLLSYYNHVTLDMIRNAITIDENGPGLQQDCLGMTPLHILACSTAQCLDLYQLMVDYYPENLIVEDSWGAIPLLYALWGTHHVGLFNFLSVVINLSIQVMNSIGLPW